MPGLSREGHNSQILMVGYWIRICQYADPEKLRDRFKDGYNDESLKAGNVVIIYPDISVGGIGGSSLMNNMKMIN